MNYKHGHCKNDTGLSPTYNTWRKMVERCTNPKDISYHNYGGRGVNVPDKWKAFQGFLDDMGVRPAAMYLDRIDNSRDYSKENCKWSTKSQQARNRRTNRHVTINGVTKLLIDWAEEAGIKLPTLWKRLEDKCPESELLRKVR